MKWDKAGRDGTQKLETRDGTGYKSLKHRTGRDSQKRIMRDGTGRDGFLCRPTELCVRQRTADNSE